MDKCVRIMKARGELDDFYRWIALPKAVKNFLPEHEFTSHDASEDALAASKLLVELWKNQDLLIE